MKTNHDFRLPPMKERIRLDEIPARLSTFKEIKCEAGHIVTCEVRIDNVRHMLMLVYNVNTRHTQINGYFHACVEYADILKRAIAGFESYLNSVHI